MTTVRNRMSATRTLTIGLAALALWSVPPAAGWSEIAAQQRPLLMEGASTLYQRVLTRPGATLATAPGGSEVSRYPAFQPLYVFAREGEWTQVGPSMSGAPEGWVQTAEVVDWKQNIVASFTNPAGRQLQFLFESEERLRGLMENEALTRVQDELLFRASMSLLSPADGIVAIEPENYVNIQDELYLMPILDFVEDWHPLNYDSNLLMQVASVPLVEQAPQSAVASSDNEFDAGIVFVLDTTRSMGPYIERTRRALERIVADIEGTDIGARMNFGAVAFRDSIEAVPELDYVTKVLTPLERREDQTPVLEAIQDATNVAVASSLGFNEDSLAGVEDAIDTIDWNQDGVDPFDGRYVILVTDAGPRQANDPHARSAVGPAELQIDAEGKGIVVMTLHLLTSDGGAANHEYAAGQYRALSRFGANQFYYPIEGGSEDAFESVVTLLVTALTDHVRAARGEETVLADDEAGAELVELGRAMRLAYLGAQEGTQAPSVFDGWVSEKAVENPAAQAIQPRLLITKNELSTMAELLDSLLGIGEATRDEADASTFFNQVQDVIARMAQNPDSLVSAGSDTLGGALEFLENLPYRSQLLTIDAERWGQSAVIRRSILDGMRQKLAQYRRWLFDQSVWTPLYDSAPDGEWVFAMPFDVLP